MNRLAKHIHALAALSALGALLCPPATANSLSDNDHPMGCELYVARSPASGRTGSDGDLNDWFKQLNADCDPNQSSCPNGGHNGIVKLGQFAMSHDNKSLVFNYENDNPQPEYFDAPPPPSDPNSSMTDKMSNTWNKWTGADEDCVTTHQFAGAGNDAEMDHNSAFSCHNNGSWATHVWNSHVQPWQIASGSTIRVLGRNPGNIQNQNADHPGVNQLIFVGDGCASLAGARAWNPGSKCQFTHSNSVCTNDTPDPIVQKLAKYYGDLMDSPAKTPDPTQSAKSIGMYSGTASSRPDGQPASDGLYWRSNLRWGTIIH